MKKSPINEQGRIACGFQNINKKIFGQSDLKKPSCISHIPFLPVSTKLLCC